MRLTMYWRLSCTGLVLKWTKTKMTVFFPTYVQAAAIGALALNRTMGFRLHDVQVAGAMATASGAVIQMQTGEGKTMVCGLAAMIRSVIDPCVHVATTNAYLAERDHATCNPRFRFYS